MKKTIIISILTISIFALFLSFFQNNTVIEYPGIKIQGIKIFYFNPSELPFNHFWLTTEYTEKHKKDIIPDGEAIFFANKNLIWVYDVDKKVKNSRIPESKKEYFYKQKSDNEVLISKDKKTWKKLEVKVISLTPKPHFVFSKAKIICSLELKCPWFKGEYLLFMEDAFDAEESDGEDH